jgi:anti-anti-sigma regulatory factor
MASQPIIPALADIEVSARLITRAFTHEEPAGQDCRTLALDLSGVKVPTAGGLGQLVALNNRLLALGRRLVLCNVGPGAFEVFELTRLTELLDVRRQGQVRPPAGPET